MSDRSFYDDKYGLPGMVVGHEYKAGPVEYVSKQLSLARGVRPWMIHALKGKGKTTVMMGIALAYAAGHRYALGGAIKLDITGGPIFWFPYEGAGEVAHKFREIADAMGLDFDGMDNLHISRQLRYGPQNADRDYMERWAQKLPPNAICFIDSLKAATPSGVEENSAAFGQTMSQYGYIGNRADALFVVAAHESRNKPGTPRGHTIAGDLSSLMTKLTSTKKVVGAQTTISVTMECGEKSSHGPEHSPVHFDMTFEGTGFQGFVGTTGPIADTDIVQAVPHQADANQQRQLVLKMLSAEPISQRKVRSALKISNGQARDHLTALADAGLATQTKAGWILGEPEAQTPAQPAEGTGTDGVV